ncbi:hypothetical protein AVEN_216891-1 [Araneus ventricosus]|uniref:SCAN domain-containing protein 3 n=1 Tax=Araneus ventricosus TaxID=182803 RepID=A0A4Y2HT58_ARAVE|nr:hypothetical protein AVEN_216891-1 [Araneus ventricosus]
MSVQEEDQLLEITNDGDLKTTFETTTLMVFWIKVMAEYPEIATKALKPLLPFPTTYLCEAAFSAVTATKTTEYTGHKQHTSGVIVFYYPQMKPSRCKETSSGFSLI